jgi:uncharacterized protein YggT (Ycf19 family)
LRQAAADDPGLTKHATRNTHHVFVGLIDFILNLACLLLWLNWRSMRFDPLGQRTPATLIGTLRRAEPRRLRHWHLLAAIGGLLLLRAGFYWQIGSASKPVWAGTLDLGIIAPAFLSNSFGRMCLFSVFSFGLMLAVFYLWLLLLSILAGPEPVHGLVRMQLGYMDRWPRWLKFFLPLAGGTLLWGLLSWPFPWLHPQPAMSTAQHSQEALLIGLGSYLVWKFLIGALLALHLLNSYVYFGKHPFWDYVSATAQTLLQPLKKIPLRAGRVDFAPVVGMVLVFLLAGLAERGLTFIYRRMSV